MLKLTNLYSAIDEPTKIPQHVIIAYKSMAIPFIFFFFFFNDPAPPEIYTLPLHDALPISLDDSHDRRHGVVVEDPPTARAAMAAVAFDTHGRQPSAAPQAEPRSVAHTARGASAARIARAMSCSARADSRSGAVATSGSPRSAETASSRSNGTLPRYGIPPSAASLAASGPGKSPAMFSTSPRTGDFVCAATVIDFRTTRWDTSDGIVTMTIPSVGTSEAIVRSRSVPGGRSRTSASSVPQFVSARNSRIAFASTVPRQVWASSWTGASHERGVGAAARSRGIRTNFTSSGAPRRP